MATHAKTRKVTATSFFCQAVILAGGVDGMDGRTESAMRHIHPSYPSYLRNGKVDNCTIAPAPLGIEPNNEYLTRLDNNLFYI